MHMFEGLNLIIDTCESVFQGPTLPVTCGSVSGILHKSRFATGLFHILILTDDFDRYCECDPGPQNIWVNFFKLPL